MSCIDGRMITREFFPQYIGREDEINMGLCYKWAYIAACLYPDVTIWSNRGHAFVEKNGLFYDSESPDGVEDMKSLGCNSRTGRGEGDSWIQTRRELIQYWKYNGCTGFEDRDEWYQKVRNFMRRKYWQEKRAEAA